MVRRGVVVLAVVIGCMVMVPAPAGVAASGPVHSDFNGDGLGDLAMGLPLRDVGSVSNAGAVWVLYATPRGFTQVKAELWTQNSPGIPDSAEAEEAWGTASAPADFNGDGFADLALSSTNDLGITVIFGSPSGLRGPGAQFLYESVDQYRGLAGGNFNGDGFADLAWISLSGSLYVRLGSASGLGTSGSVWTPDSPGICDDGQWGDALASGDLNGDGFDDLAIGDRTENVEGAQEAGQIQVLYGAADGITATGNECWNQASPGIQDDPGLGDHLGWDVAAGDFNSDGFDDLAAGAAGEGKVNVIYGSAAGLTDVGNQLLVGYSAALATGDFNGDGFAELASGDPEYSGQATAQGRVLVAYGSSSGLLLDALQQWDQGSPSIPDEPENGDFFGAALAVGAFGKGTADDLAIGVPFEDSGSQLRNRDTGAVHVLYGSPSGLVANGNQFFALPKSRITTNDELGYSLNGQQCLSH